MPAFEYLHTWIPAIEGLPEAGEEEELDEEERYEEEIDGQEPEEEPSARPADYAFEAVQANLNELGQYGWELVSMVPQWEVPEALPEDLDEPEEGEYVLGWYCTFKRPRSG